MGKGGNATVDTKRTSTDGGSKKNKNVIKRAVTSMQGVKQDLSVLKSIWLRPLSGLDHASRLEHFYAPQAQLYDRFRSSFLWGRERLVQACAARLESEKDLVWVDLGGGTGENVKMMSQCMDLRKFKKIYVVDLCTSLCDVARQKVKENGWKNVEVVEGDACHFQPPHGKADLVTFSYSLSMIPPFHHACDNARSLLKEGGLLGVADFYVSSKYDLPCRQQSSLTRWFWRCAFDTDNIDLGPERRCYLDHSMQRVWEYNGKGSIPYVPYLKAPYYVWLGTNVKTVEGAEAVAKSTRPHLFPPTFLYSLSWEDPVVDEPFLDIGPNDTMLTLTSGGCNAFHVLLNKPAGVYCVDMNPAQSHLVELKTEAIRRLPYEDVWKMFGEGKHPQFKELFTKKLAPFLNERTYDFWNKYQCMFANGLYYYGSMGLVIWAWSIFTYVFCMRGWVNQLVNAPTLEEQRKVWRNATLIRLLSAIPEWLMMFAARLLCNQAFMWGCLGVPANQARLILKDGRHFGEYIATVFGGAAEHTSLRTENYFYRVCLKGSFSKDCCPHYLKEEHFNRLKDEKLLDRLHNVTGSFMDELNKRMYTRVILMDHTDWTDEKYVLELTRNLAKQVSKGGKVILRSASKNPWYIPYIEEAGFKMKCVHRHHEVEVLDCVNMYASFWVATKL